MLPICDAGGDSRAERHDGLSRCSSANYRALSFRVWTYYAPWVWHRESVLAGVPCPSLRHNHLDELARYLRTVWKVGLLLSDSANLASVSAGESALGPLPRMQRGTVALARKHSSALPDIAASILDQPRIAWRCLGSAF